MPTTLIEIFRDSETQHRLSLFDFADLKGLESQVFEKNGKPYLKCLATDKDRPAKPEEIVRQLWIKRLLSQYGYPKKRLAIEHPVSFGSETKRADIVVFDRDRPTVEYIVVELKSTKLKDGKSQLKSYCNATGAPIGIWSNGEQYSFYNRKDPNYFNDITEIPSATQTLTEILNERFTLDDLIKRDKLVTERKSLKDLILEMEDEVLANAGVDVFEELFKLIFTKLYDEMTSGQNRKRSLEFRNAGTEGELKSKIQNLFDKAKAKWEGVFPSDDKVKLSPSHLSVCVASLENVKLFNSNLDVVDEAFEYLVGKSSKGEKGQYFTPRYVIDMCVKMMNPKADEFIIDTASGSAGFPVHSIFKVWRDIFRDEKIPESDLFTLETKPQACYDYVGEKVFAIDFDEKVVRVARCLNLIAGDGQTNVLHLNTLDYERWDESTKSEEWNDIYNEGFKRLKKLRRDKTSWKEFNFDVLMANPPFAGDIKETRIIAKYELGKKSSGKYETAVGRDLLFIERNLDFLKGAGRMAVVLPQGRFNNLSDKSLRDYIGERCRILAVVGLHGNTFKPHTGTKTSVLFVQKWTDEQAAKRLAIRNEHAMEFKKHFEELEQAVKHLLPGVPELARGILAEELGTEKDDEDLAEEKKTFGKPLSRFRESELETEARKLETKAKGETFPKARFSMLGKARRMRRELAGRGGKWALLYLVENLRHEYEKRWFAKRAVGTELDYNIFFATQRRQGKDTSGDKIFVKRPVPPGSMTRATSAVTGKQEEMPLQEVPDTYNAKPPTGDFLLDLHGHLIVDHDLFNHDGLTQPGIAEAFQEFAKKEKLSFF
ncbi:MAG: Type restriction modification system, Methylase [Verrucomicrobiales bacterium]|nr:Type restriction modification system, Methylase [Verrucomicrobiales bacterium]